MSGDERREGAVTVVVNPVSGEGHGQELAETLVTALRDQGRTVRMVVTEGEGDMARLVGEACDSGAALVVVVGGDGAVQAAVDMIARRDPRPSLAHLPAGTTNAIARAFGLKDDPGGLAALIAAGEIRTIDLGYLEDRDRYFLLMATVGDPTRVVTGASRELKDRLGFGAYLAAAARAAASPKHASVTLHCDQQTLRRKVNGILLANVARLERPAVTIAPDGAYDDGRLDLVLLSTRGFLGWFRLACAWLLRRCGDGKSLEFRSIQRCTVEAVPPLPVQIDGEFAGETPVTVVVAPAVLTLVMPAEAGAADD
ncbi:MAG: YegS/Rv2252/BmrU family lipid kinase [bacterium]